LGEKLNEAFDRFGNWIGNATDDVGDVFETSIDWIANKSEKAWDKTSDWVENATDDIGDYFEKAWNKTKNITVRVGEKFADVALFTWLAVKETTIDVFEWIRFEWNDMEDEMQEEIVEAAVWI